MGIRLIALLLLSACTSPSLSWHMVSPAELREQAVRAGLPPNVRAFALKTATNCTIYSMRPEHWQEMLEIWFHEKRHCDEGSFH